MRHSRTTAVQENCERTGQKQQRNEWFRNGTGYYWHTGFAFISEGLDNASSREEWCIHLNPSIVRCFTNFEFYS